MSFAVAADAYDRFMGRYSGPLTAQFADFAGVSPGQRVLDVGCGTGHQAAELAANGVVVVGIDADQAMLDIARHDHPDIRFRRVDAQDPTAVRDVVDSTGGPFDAVLSNAALHWMPHQDDVVAAIGAALRPGGRLVVEMGGDGNVARVTAAVRRARADIGLDPDVGLPWTFPTPAQMSTRLEAHGFVVRLARDGIREATGWDATQPLSGQRCLTREAYSAAVTTRMVLVDRAGN